MFYLQKTQFRSLAQFTVLTIAAIGFQFCAQHARAQTSANLLTDPGFELNPLSTFSAVLSGTEDVWGVEDAAIVGTTGTVNPLGTMMLAMMPGSAGSTATQAIQLAAVPTAFETGIDAGSATVDMSAFFNVAANAPNASGSAIIEFLNAAKVPIGTFFSVSTNSLGPNGLDADPLTWENVLIDDAPVPSLTRFFRAQVAYNNVSLAGNLGFVDNADLRITIPEPATLFLATLGLMGIGCRRRKRA